MGEAGAILQGSGETARGVERRKPRRGPFPGYLCRLALCLLCAGAALGVMNFFVDPRCAFHDGVPARETARPAGGRTPRVDGAGAPARAGDAAGGVSTQGGNAAQDRRPGPLGALSAFLDPYKPRGGSRIVKAEMLRRGGWDAILLGSSRVETGIDPEDPIWGGKRVYNGGLMALGWQELLDVLRYIERAGHGEGIARPWPSEGIEPSGHTGRPEGIACPGPTEHGRVAEELFIFVDFFTFLSIRTNEVLEREFAVSRFDEGRDLRTYRLSNLLSAEAAQDSLQTIFNAARGRVGEWTPLGLRWQPVGAHLPQLDLFKRTLTREAAAFSAARYVPDAVDQLGARVQALLAKGYRITLAVPPLHALSLEVVRLTGHLDDFSRWKRDLVRVLRDPSLPNATLVPVWDFAEYHPITTEALALSGGALSGGQGSGSPGSDGAESRGPERGDPRGLGTPDRMRWFVESTHFRTELGAIFIARMRDRTAELPPVAEGLGAILTPEGMGCHLEAFEVARAAYVDAHGAEIRWLEELIRTAVTSDGAGTSRQ